MDKSSKIGLGYSFNVLDERMMIILQNNSNLSTIQTLYKQLVDLKAEYNNLKMEAKTAMQVAFENILKTQKPFHDQISKVVEIVEHKDQSSVGIQTE